MTKSNQILDVSYGTFSCRLEGFEDSVEVMKTVVSYFHELAGHDRFMDVEPQAPDMEELALLTAAKADSDVEIAGEGHNVALRAVDEDAEEEIVAADDVEEIIAEDETFEDDEEIAENIVADDDIDDVEVAEEDEDPISLTAQEDDEDAFDDEDFTNITDEDEEFVEDLEDEEPLQAEAPEEPEAFEEEESIAAKLQRIRAVVGRGHVQAPATETATEEATTAADDDEEEIPVNPLAQRLADLAKRNAELDAEEAAEAEATAEVDEIEDDYDDELADDTEEPLVLTAANDDGGSADDDHFDLQDEAAVETNRSKREELTDTPESAMSRILMQTDEHLKEPEGRRHRDAFAQLKAAVAATEAAKQLGDDAPTEDRDEAFREDLGAHEAEIQSEVRESAPLRLVPSQRTESDDKPVDAAAERLRKIASKKKTDTTTGAGGFAEFAQQQGATELGDLLEAAAAYIAFVEGDDDFSRPQVMKKVQSATAQEITREDGLRSFGRLLRQSKIVKLNNGRFQVAENTRFRPDASA
ncbi:hypothetical protein [Loktanella sp. S4079]|uniref:hypothetical protein n=1 Tax=Loktanella sp. S4079 TaxID=579483 RepID=UPI0005FA0E3D|nr:hypothetical protein [Loktanella sp. S4079]